MDDFEEQQELQPGRTDFAWKNDWYDKYIGTMSSDKIAGAVLEKARLWNTRMTGRLDQWRRNYLLYHNVDPFSGRAASFDIVGENAEYMELRINHYRNLMTILMNLVFAKQDALKTVASNAEPESTHAADMFDAYLEEIFKSQRAGRMIKKTGELSLVFDTAFQSVTWDPAAGEKWAPRSNGQIINTGGPKIRARSVLDACFDVGVDDWGDLPYFIERVPFNRFELLAQYPDKEDAILAAPTIEESTDYAPALCDSDESDQIWTWVFYHRPINSLILPAGRMTIVLDDDTTLYDGDNPYEEIPILRMVPMEGIGSLFGYTPANDIAPLQQFYNMTMRAIATGVAANGVGNLIAPRGSDIDLESLIGGANIVYYNPVAGSKPETLNLLQMTPELQALPQAIERIMETISGVNSVARGNPDSSLKSGRALAIVQSMTVQFASGYHQSKTNLSEDTGNLLLRQGQRWMTQDQMVSIIGESKFAKSGTINSESLRKLARVRAEAVDPAYYTMAGKMEAADKLMSTGAIKTPQEYFEVARTGNLEVLTNANVSMTRGIRDENSALLRGEMVDVLSTDDHPAHLAEHLTLFDGPEARRNMQAGRMQAAMQHVMQHQQMAAQAQMPGGAPLPGQTQGAPQPQQPGPGPQQSAPPPGPQPAEMSPEMPQEPSTSQ